MKILEVASTDDAPNITVYRLGPVIVASQEPLEPTGERSYVTIPVSAANELANALLNLDGE